MTPYSVTLLLLLVVSLSSCTTDAPDTAAPPVPPHPLADTLAAVRADYEALRLPDALARARRLRVMMEADSAGVPDPVRAEGYQYMAMLLFDEHYHRDSVNIYVELAEPLVEESSAVDMRARQLLISAYRSYVDWAYLEMRMHSAFARHLLDEAGQGRNLLYGLLLTIEGRGGKKHADKVKEDDRQISWWSRSEENMRAASALLHDLNSPWESYPRSHLAILMARQEKYDRSFRKFVDSVDSGVKPRAPIFAYRDYLLGYWHWERGRGDSADYYLRRLLEDRPLFLHQMEYVASFILTAHAENNGRYLQTIELALAEMETEGCCPNGAGDAGSCQQRADCVYEWSHLGYQYLKLYKSTGAIEHLQQAYSISQTAFQSFIENFRENEEEAALNKSRILSDRLIIQTLRSAIATASTTPEAAYVDAVFAAVEFGRTYLLVQELSDNIDSTNQRARDDITLRMVECETGIKVLKAHMDASYTLEVGDFQKYQGFENERRKLRKQLENRKRHQLRENNLSTVNNLDPMREQPRIADVQSQLGNQQAFVEFAEMDEDLIVLYVDRETKSIHTVPMASVERELDLFTSLLAAPQPAPVGQYASTAYFLYHTLLGPIATEVASHTELLIAPCALLGTLPFAALVTELDTVPTTTYQTLTYLLDRHAIRYLSSWRTEGQLASLRVDRSTPVQTKVGVWTHGGLQNYFGHLSTGNLRHIGQRINRYEKSSSTTKSFLQHAPEYDVLHLSVHAVGNENRLHENYLYLSRVDSLNGLAVSGTQLQAWLVVLAACSTATGQAMPREGTYSLLRSFHLAGVPDVIASLYDLPAPATAKLLDQFYGELAAGHTIAEALARAQRSARNGSFGPRYQYPNQWGGLIVG